MKSKQSRWMSPGKAAQMFGVHPATIVRWIEGGKLSAVRTPGGHRRLLTEEVEKLARQFGILEPVVVKPVRLKR